MSGAEEPKPGSTAKASLVVTDDMLASALSLESQDAYPPVFATARMIALMEIASARILVPYLPPGHMSVGVGIDATHTAPTPTGATVTAVSTYLGRKGKLYEFEIVATDPGGEIGKCRHTRGVVETERIVKGSKKRGKL